MNIKAKMGGVPKWVVSYVSFFAVCWVVFFFMRFVFLFVYRAGITAAVKPYLLQALYIGAKFDMRLAAFLAIPLGLFVFIGSFFRKVPKILKIILGVLYTVILTVVCLSYAADFGQYSYLAIRVNSSIFTYLENAAISFQMVWETYPVVWVIIGFIVLIFLIYKFASFFINMGFDGKKDGWKKKTAWGAGLLVLTFAACWGALGQYPLRWSNAYFTSNNFVSNLALNPMLNVIDTYSFAREVPYDIEKVKKYYPMMADFLGVDKPDINTLNFERVRPGKDLGKKYNVVLIFMESFAWNKSSFTNDGKFDATPNAKKLAADSLLFSQYYSPTSATARSVFAALASIPDVTSFQTSSRNPLIVNQNMIANSYDGYEKMYFIGGSASWGNIRGLLSHNLDGLRLYEEGDYTSPRNDVWGISDWDLFHEADAVLKKETKPFFAVIQTAGYHRPYTIPQNHGDFQEVTGLTQDELTDHSFNSIEEFNSLRFSDYALGEFIRLAKQSPYYKDTVFVIYGDHGLAAAKSVNMPRGYVEYNLINQQVPLIIHAPALVKPAVIDRTASEVDIMPTVSALIGQPYRTAALGRDILDPAFKNKAGALVFGWSSYPPIIAYVSGDDFYFDKAGSEGLYKFEDPKNYNVNLQTQNKVLFDKMNDMAHALYETSRYMLYNNKKIEEKK
ncbi:MAG: sulfatase-like hydrolase/transferase [Elusimicrobia bacterium]|nr:sulfatase-like hydrolase/transferase [Elusimicrobiota bacterium]